jgi:selenocysteine lyase/cysteine desulfurase
VIYFDNAATSRPKPEEVYDAFQYYARQIGTSPGRGSYGLALQASRMLYQSRRTVSGFFGGSDPSNVVFTKNATEAINLFFDGFLSAGDHVLISPYEHNAVLRPLQTLKDKGVIDYSVLPEEAVYQPERLGEFIRPSTKLLAVTLASNLTGQLVFHGALSKKAHELGVQVFVDSSQGGGKQLLDMKRDHIDYLAFTGHKDLLALPGVGGLVSARSLVIPPLIQGGTGVHGECYVNPQVFPDSYEAGTVNMPAIWSLKTSLEYIRRHGREMRETEEELLEYFMEALASDPRVIVYNKDKRRVPTFCFNLEGVPGSAVVEALGEHEICVRGGLHCAIKAHETLGTFGTGAVRVSLSSFNTRAEIDEFLKALKGIL